MIALTRDLINELQQLPNPAAHHSTVYTLILVDPMTLEPQEVDLIAIRTVIGWQWAIKLNEK